MSEPTTQVLLSVDDFFLRNEWAGDVPVVSTEEIKPEQDLRVLDMFENFEVHATFFIPGIIADLFPEAVHSVTNRGFEVAAHGFRHENLSSLRENARRQLILKSVGVLEKCANKNVLGWRSPGLHIDNGLFRALKDTHIEWCSNVELPSGLRHVPFVFRGKTELPISSVDLKAFRGDISPDRICRKWLASLQKGNAIFTLVLHPWFQLSKPERFSSLKLFLEKAVTLENVKFSSGSEIYERFVSQGGSVYGNILSVASNLWKHFSRMAQGPILAAQKLLSTEF